MFEFLEPIDDFDLNRKRNIMLAVDNLFTQIGDPVNRKERALMAELIILKAEYYNDLAIYYLCGN